MARRRHDAIARLRLVESAGDPSLTAFARLAAYVTGASTAGVHVLDDLHQHRIAGVGAPLDQHPREDTLCRLVVDGEERIVCADITRESRFSYTSSVRGDTPVRFYTGLPLRTSDGAVVGTLCCWDTVAISPSDEQLARLEDLAGQLVARMELLRIAVDLSHAAGHDALTGAVNRLVLDDRLAMAIARRLRRGGDVLLASMDIDGFKAINDQHGHAAGDEVLVAVAARLVAATRAEDTVARLGGDEFVVVAEIEETSVDVDVDALVRRIQKALDEPFRFAGADRWVGVSVGTARFEPGDDLPAAFARADREMYARKAAAAAPPKP